MTTTVQHTTNPVVPLPAVCRELGMSRRTFGRLMLSGDAPTVLRLSPRKLGVRRSALDRWLADREH